jgi:hypothetical protein
VGVKSSRVCFFSVFIAPSKSVSVGRFYRFSIAIGSIHLKFI